MTSPNRLRDVRGDLAALRGDVAASAILAEAAGRLVGVHPVFQASGWNLLHYLAFRRHDLRPLQRSLAALGMSSLGRSEAHVLATLDATLATVDALGGLGWYPPAPSLHFEEGRRLLTAHTDALLGPTTPGRDVRVMVTLPSEAADDGGRLIHDLVAQGVEGVRINCAHDDAPRWARMITHVREAEHASGRPCRVLMDLAGPKLRTGPLAPGPAVAKVRPRRDACGRVIDPARVWLSAGVTPPAPGAVTLPVPPAWVERLHTGDPIRLVDARGARRRFRVVGVARGGCWAESQKTAYVVPGTTLVGPTGTSATVGDLPAREVPIRLGLGNVLVVTRDLTPGHPASTGDNGRIARPAQIGCTLPEVFDDVHVGEPIWFDDGKIGGVIESVDSARVHVRVTQCREGGHLLRGDKGINLPESALRLHALTPKDRADLRFVACHADAVGLSFVNRPEDVDALHQQLAALTDAPPAVVIKIETRRAFAALPDLLLAAMRAPSCGVMIARGDLAVECGFERLAEVQEEILWVCEAAHVPVIWATQVLESLTKDGMPSRAEVTDAAAGHRAECVLLNKGPHVRSAVEALDDILRRMAGHQTKKHAELRALHLAAPSGYGASQSARAMSAVTTT